MSIGRPYVIIDLSYEKEITIRISHVLRWKWLSLLGFATLASAAAKKSCFPVASPTTSYRYTIEPGDILSGVLWKIEIDDAKLCLYGDKGWVKFNIGKNPEIAFWDKLMPGTQISLHIPASITPRPDFPQVATQVVPQPEAPPSIPTPTPTPQPPAVEVPAAVEREQKSDENALTKIKDLASETIDNLIKLRPKSFVGVRAGKSFSRDPFLKNSNFYGLVAELAGGPLAGTRFYWDLVPKSSRTTDGGISYGYGWQRFVLGYAFAIPKPQWIDGIHVVPKIGRYTFEGDLPVDNGAGLFESKNFRLIGFFSLGYEIDVEVDMDPIKIRPWIGQDISGSLVGLKTDTSVISNRLGTDLIIDGPKFKNDTLALSYLLFGVYEDLVILAKNQNKTATGTEDLRINFATPYLGAGLGLRF